MNIPQATVVVCNVDHNLKVYSIHHPTHYMAQNGVPTTLWGNHVNATNGDVVFLEDPFHLSSSIRVLTENLIHQFIVLMYRLN